MKQQEYEGLAQTTGCSIGFATGGLRVPTDAIGRLTLQAIDMGCYRRLQRGLMKRDWGRKKPVTRYREMIKELRNAKAESGKV
jgi:hypothetical protein